MKSDPFLDFIRESNHIEGITRPPTRNEIEVSHWFIELDTIEVPNLELFVSTVQPGAKLRTKRGMDVRVGNHTPPPGGPFIEPELKGIVGAAQQGIHPFHTHQVYEALHPFMDGNGRSGRILWAWQMLEQRRWPGMQLGFLQLFYYQSLEFYPRRRPA